MPALGKYDKRPGVKKKIDDIPQWQKVFEEVMAEDIAADKKPVRWNFLKDSEGLLNLGLTLAPDIKLMIASGLAKKGIEPDPIKYFRETKINERDYIDGFDDIAKAIDSGVHTLSWSIGDLLFMGIPALQGDSTFRDKFNKMMEESQPEAPETWQGDLVSLLVQFGVPASVITKIGARAKSVQKIKNLLFHISSYSPLFLGYSISSVSTISDLSNSMVSAIPFLVMVIVVSFHSSSNIQTPFISTMYCFILACSFLGYLFNLSCSMLSILQYNSLPSSVFLVHSLFSGSGSVHLS